jgi:hypothetical protein
MKRLQYNEKLYWIGVRIHKYPELLGRFPIQSDIDKYYHPEWDKELKEKLATEKSFSLPHRLHVTN